MAIHPSWSGAQSNVEFLLLGKTIKCFEREKERYYEIIIGNEYYYIAPGLCPDGGSEENDIGVSTNLNDIIIAESLGGVSLVETDKPTEHILIYLSRSQFGCATGLAASENIEDDEVYTFNPENCSIEKAR